MLALGIETSCDETAVAVVRDDGEILSNIIFSQIELHQPYGGVVPEIAARSHLSHIHNVYNMALDEAKLTLDDINIIGATAGPGLIGGLIVGLMFGKGLAASSNKPFIAVNHLEGHALTVRLTHKIKFPYLLLLASGGHCQFLLVKNTGDYLRLGATQDDAMGEAFDKVAKMLGLGYPGGPAVEKAAANGDSLRYPMPLPMLGRVGCDFSFSGLKTAVRRLVESYEQSELEKVTPDICASFQHTVCRIVRDRAVNAIAMAREIMPVETLVIAGGVAANISIRTELEEIAHISGIEAVAPPLKLCTDNAAMIAWAAIENFKCYGSSPITAVPKARWPL